MKAEQKKEAERLAEIEAFRVKAEQAARRKEEAERLAREVEEDKRRKELESYNEAYGKVNKLSFFTAMIYWGVCGLIMAICMCACDFSYNAFIDYLDEGLLMSAVVFVPVYIFSNQNWFRKKLVSKIVDTKEQRDKYIVFLPGMVMTMIVWGGVCHSRAAHVDV